MKFTPDMVEKATDPEIDQDMKFYVMDKFTDDVSQCLENFTLAKVSKTRNEIWIVVIPSALDPVFDVLFDAQITNL
jgi:hypothetical protein